MKHLLFMVLLLFGRPLWQKRVGMAFALLLSYTSCSHTDYSPLDSKASKRYFEGWSCAPRGQLREEHIPAHCASNVRSVDYFYAIETGAASQRSIDEEDPVAMALTCEESVRKRLEDDAEFAGFLYRLLHPSFVSSVSSGVVDLKEKQWINRVQPFVQKWQRGITTCCAAEGDSSACISKTGGLYFDICHCQVWIEVPGGRATLNRMTK